MFVPLESLTESVIKSIVCVATTFRRSSFDYSERTLLAFLLQIESKLRESEATQYIPIRQCLSTVNWKELRLKYERIQNLNCDEMARYFKSPTSQPYFELTCPTVCFLYFELIRMFFKTIVRLMLVFYNLENI